MSRDIEQRIHDLEERHFSLRREHDLLLVERDSLKGVKIRISRHISTLKT